MPGGALAVELVTETACAETDGSCGIGVMRRVAIEVAVEGVGAAVVFDHNAEGLGDYMIEAGQLHYDEGNCEGHSETWYEFVILRQ